MKIMNKTLLFFLFVLIPVCGYSQDSIKTDLKSIEDGVDVALQKATAAAASVVKFVVDEVKQFKDEAVENMPEETKQNIREAKENLKYELKYMHDAIHAGWAAGWRGEPYTPPYKHK